MQLRMLYSPDQSPLPELFIPEGFEIRALELSDLKEWGEILHPACEFSFKDSEYCANFFKLALPGGIIGAYEKSSGRLAATATAQYMECEIPGGLGWVMALPEIRGKKLGAAVVAAAMNHGIRNGLSLMCLATDDHRLPAIGLYLKYGSRPYLFAEDMPDRWRNVLKNLNLAPETVEDYSLSEDLKVKVNHTL